MYISINTLGVKREFNINSPVATIGRNPQENTLHVEDPKVSKKHLLIVQNANQYRIKDLRSLNGTYVNGQKIQPEVFYNINPNSQIRIGDTLISITVTQGPKPWSPAPIPPTSSPFPTNKMMGSMILVGVFLYIIVGIIYRVNFFDISNIIKNAGGALWNTLLGGAGIFEYFQNLIGIFIISLVILFIGQTFILWGSSVIIGARKASFLFSLLANFAGIAAGFIVGLLFGLMFKNSDSLAAGVVLALIVNLALIPLLYKLIYGTTYGRGAAIMFLSIVISLVSAGILAAIAIAGMPSLFY